MNKPTTPTNAINVPEVSPQQIAQRMFRYTVTMTRMPEDEENQTGQGALRYYDHMTTLEKILNEWADLKTQQQQLEQHKK